MLVKYYADIDLMKERFKINNDWTMALDGPFMVKHNIMKYEGTTAKFFPKQSMKLKAKELRGSKIEYINNATAHYWVISDAIKELETLKNKATALISQLQTELNTKDD